MRSPSALAAILIIAFASLPATIGQQFGVPVAASQGIFIPIHNNTAINNSNNFQRPNQPPSYGFANPINNNFNRPPYQPNPNFNNNPVRIPPYPYAAQNNTINNGATLNYGRREAGDKTLLRTIVRKSVPWYRSSATKDIVFPDPKSRTKIQRITCIEVIDNTKNRSGGRTDLVEGGVNHNMVRMRFEDKDGRPIDLSLNIYGYF